MLTIQPTLARQIFATQTNKQTKDFTYKNIKGMASGN
jgi:hypothetical protein